MTRQDLEELNFLRKYAEWLDRDIAKLTKSIKELVEHITALEEKADMQSPCTENLPRSASPANKLDIIIPALADERELLKEKLELLEARKKIFEGTKLAYEKKINEIETYINTLDDPFMKLIIKLRCVEQLSWAEIAAEIGGKSTETNLRQMYHRFVK